MIAVEVEILAADLAEKLDTVLSETEDKKVLDEAGAFLLNRIRSRFLREVDPEERPWLPSKAAIKRRGGGYTYRRGKKWTGTGTLYETGDLFRSIQLATIGSGDSEAKIATDIRYAKYHQYGTTALPIRRFLGFNAADADLYAKVLALRITRAIV